MTTTQRRKLYWHIGGPKTGTTYLQAVLHQNRQLLRENGLLYPGDKKQAHYWASQDLSGNYFHGHANPNVDGAWHRLVAEIAGWDGPALIDHELFVNITNETIDKAMSELTEQAGTEVHLVWTARDLARQIPAAWQEHLKNRGTTTYAEYIGRVRARKADDGVATAFWRQHGTPGILERWSRSLPPERVHLITVPPRGSDPQLLWRRFAGVLGVDPERFDTDTGKRNSSLGAAEATVVRRLNKLLAGHDISWPVYSGRLKHGAVDLMAEQARTGPIGLPEDVYDWALEWSRSAVSDLAVAGYDVTGDLAELIPGERPRGADPDTVEAADLADAALAGMAALLRLPGQNWRAGSAPEARPRGGQAKATAPAAAAAPDSAAGTPAQRTPEISRAGGARQVYRSLRRRLR